MSPRGSGVENIIRCNAIIGINRRIVFKFNDSSSSLLTPATQTKTSVMRATTINIAMRYSTAHAVNKKKQTICVIVLFKNLPSLRRQSTPRN
ncbi:unnamed protein product [Trichogramma brassicae]|uniref:Uncharacterized protein n=1 Tax=Trichogramma brassicae TaxID=86971 RepID=A0A6H5HZA6_9HYME|nr:unnamed protein product [Trichogramma brassicae]